MTDFFSAVAENRSHEDPNDETSKLCGEVPRDSMHLVRSPLAGESDLPWTGITFGLAINSIWYWCSDQVFINTIFSRGLVTTLGKTLISLAFQVIVQRSLASKNMIHAKGGTIVASYLKLLPMWIMVFPGMAARVLFPNTVACASPETCKDICNSRHGTGVHDTSLQVLFLKPYHFIKVWLHQHSFCEVGE